MKLSASKIKSFFIFCLIIWIYGCNGGGNSGNGNESNSGNNLSIIAISIVGTETQLVKNTHTELTATATLSDGTVQDITTQVIWKSSDSSVLSISSKGVALAGSAGKADVSASLNGVNSNTLTINVNAPMAVLTSILISVGDDTPAKGTLVHVAAVGGFSDGTVQDITAQVIWKSSDNSILSIAGDGVASANKAGAASVSASYDGVTSNVIPFNVHVSAIKSLTISADNNNPAKGTVAHLSAVGTFTDNSTQDITTQVIWKSSDSSVINIAANGDASADNVGIAAVSASFNGINSNALAVNVIKPVATGISIVGGNTIRPNSKFQLYAKQNYSDDSFVDITDAGIWNSNNSVAITVSSSGFLTAVAGSGSAIISFNYKGKIINQNFTISRF